MPAKYFILSGEPSQVAATRWGAMIEANLLTKYYKKIPVVSEASFSVGPGKITGFIGPNGSGKSTTMKMILGLIAPTSGSATINGRVYRDLEQPIKEVGALLEPSFLHPGITIFSHLLSIAIRYNIPSTRVGELLDLVSLSGKKKLRCGQASLGMKQRLGIAQALLGDPNIVILDEPMNGLDPDGIIWLRTYLRHLADEGKCIFISSHLMNEMALLIDEVIMIKEGKLIAGGSLPDLISGHSSAYIEVLTSDNAALTAALKAYSGQAIVASAVIDGDVFIKVRGISTKEVGNIALENDIAVYHLRQTLRSLEDIYLDLVNTEQKENIDAIK